MIEIQSVRFRNFLSYGDYDTVVDFTNLKQCFIMGTVLDGEDTWPKKSNGAGKSTISQAILWCLSGSTMHSPNPGAGIKHWFNDADCVVEVTLKDGSQVIRSRTSTGHTELFYRKNGVELIDAALSTTKNQQKELERQLNFNYDIFCGSVFLSQHRNKWLQMSEAKRKQLFEQTMGLDRLSVYAEVAKSKKAEYEIQAERLKALISAKGDLILELTTQIDDILEASLKFTTRLSDTRAAKLLEAKTYRDKAAQTQSIDLVALKAKWAVVTQIEAKVAELKKQVAAADAEVSRLRLAEANSRVERESQISTWQDNINTLQAELQKRTTAATSTLQREKNTLAAQNADVKKKLSEAIIPIRQQHAIKIAAVEAATKLIATWEEKNGQICLACEQEVASDHVHGKIDELRAELALQAESAALLQETLNQYNANIADLDESLQVSFAEAEEDVASGLAVMTSKLEVGIAGLQAKIAASRGSVVVSGNEEIAKHVAIASNLRTTLAAVESRLETGRPAMSVELAELEIGRQGLLLEKAAALESEADAVLLELNPHDPSALRGRLAVLEKDVVALSADLETVSVSLDHMQYVYKAYSDRSKIKGYIISKYNGFFNSRLEHYLDLFDLDVKTKVSDSLALTSNLWGHAFQSGGERARTEMAITFAVFDLHTGVHGRQSNLLVLDEPDEGLDEVGIQSLIGIIQAELAPRFDTILVTSHRTSFKDVFPNSINVERVNRMSRIAEIR